MKLFLKKNAEESPEHPQDRIGGLYEQTTFRAYSRVCIVACVGLILSISLFILILNRNMAELEQSFQQDMGSRITALRHKSEILEQYWEDVQTFYLSSQQVDWIEFRSFSDSVLKRSELEFISWIPNTQPPPRPEDLFMVPSLGGKEHETRLFLLRSPDIQAAIEKARMEAAEKKIRSGSLVISREFVPPGLVGDGNRTRLAIVIPTWTRIPVDAGARQNIARSKPNGFVVTFLDLNGFLSGVLLPHGVSPERNIIVRMSLDGGQSFEPVFTFNAPDDAELMSFDRSAPDLRAMFETHADIPIGPAILSIEAGPSIAYLSRSANWVPWAALLLGLLLTVFVAILIFQQINRNIQITRLVHEKAGALAYSEQRMRAILNNTVDGIITINEKGIIETYNPACERLFGYSAEEVIGQNVSLLMPHPHHEKHDEYIRSYIETGQARIIGIGREVEGLRKDAGTFPIELSIGEVPRGQGRAFVGIIRDITERKRAEQELKSSHDALDDFVYIVSHDLKEPIRGMRSFSGFLMEDYKDRLDAEGADQLRMLGILSDRMEELIDTLLDYSRLGRTEMAIKSTDLNIVIDKVLDLLEPMVREKNAHITVHKPLPVMVCDRARVSEIFRNLIVNGIKYNDNDFKEIEVGCTTDHEDMRGQQVFYVADNGIGIDPQFHQKIFKIFKRLHGHDAYGGGTGSGLTIVQKIVERHGGKIWVESDGKNGSTFYFTLG